MSVGTEMDEGEDNGEINFDQTDRLRETETDEGKTAGR